MRLKSRGMIVLLLSKVVDLITAIVISFVEAVEAFEYRDVYKRQDIDSLQKRTSPISD